MQQEILRIIQNTWPEYQLGNSIQNGKCAEMFGAVRSSSASAPGLDDLASVRVVTIPPESADSAALAVKHGSAEQMESAFESMAADYVNLLNAIRGMNGTNGAARIRDCRTFKNKDSSGWVICTLTERLTPLADYLEGQESIDENEAVKLGSDIASFLETCESGNRVYGNICEDSIFVDVNGNYKVAFPGTEQAVELLCGNEKKEDVWNYLPPESSSGGRRDRTSDTYALGILLYKLLNGNRFPFVARGRENDTAAVREARKARLGGAKLPMPDDASPHLGAVVLKACDPNPANRFQSAAEMKAAIMDRNFIGVPAAPVPPMQQGPVQPVPAETGKQNGGNKKALIAILIILALALLGVGGWFAYKNFFAGNSGDPTATAEPDQTAQSGDNTAKTPEPNPGAATAVPEVPTPAPTGYPTEPYYTPAPTDEPTPDPTAVPATPQPTDAQTSVTPFEQSQYYCWGFDVGQDHVIGLLSNGHAVAEGNNNNGKCNVSGWNDIVQVAAGYYFSAGLRRDGTVVIAGSDSEYIDLNYVYSWRNIVQISAQARTLIALDSYGNVFVAGHPEKHDPSEELLSYSFPYSIRSASGAQAVSVSAGRDHVLILFADGTCAAFGREEGKAGERCDVYNWSGIVAITACQGGSVGLRANGTVVYTGGYKHDQTLVRNLTNIACIASKGYHFVYIDRNGNVGCTGDNTYGQCNVSQWNSYGNKHVVAVSGSLWVSAALFSDGSVAFIGNQNTINGFSGALNWHNIVRMR